jgi:hypothetical protein
MPAKAGVQAPFFSNKNAELIRSPFITPDEAGGQAFLRSGRKQETVVPARRERGAAALSRRKRPESGCFRGVAAHI